VQKAQAELVQGHLSAAAVLYQRATQVDPRNASAFRGLGLVNERLGRTQDAIRALRRAQALSPGDSANALLEERVRKLERSR
jgi:Flp pilus assembly protein TadD